jgi:arylsulfatase A-like enzyme
MKTTYIFLGIIISSLSICQSLIAQDKKPNVIFILVDDLGIDDVSCYGETMIKTSEIDKLASQGIKFENFYTAGATRTPTRYSILTGRYSFRSPEIATDTWKINLLQDPNDMSIATVFKQKGYKTAAIGKWHKGYGGKVKLSWDETFLPEHPFDQGDYKLRDEKLAPFPRTEDQIQAYRREYYAIISHMDEQIGKVLAALEKSGKADNTYIIFCADHGLAVGEHGLLGKQNQYDHSVRMPFFIADPGITAGKQSNAIIYMQSVFATTFELVGIEAPATVEFPSLKGVIEGNEEKVHDAIFGSYRRLQRMVPTDTHKLIVYLHNGMQQLFDLKKDPRERVNIIDDATNENLKNDMFSKLLALQKEVRDTLSLSLNNYDNQK